LTVKFFYSDDELLSLLRYDVALFWQLI